MLVYFIMGGTFGTFESGRLEDPFLSATRVALMFQQFFEILLTFSAYFRCFPVARTKLGIF